MSEILIDTLLILELLTSQSETSSHILSSIVPRTLYALTHLSFSTSGHWWLLSLLPLCRGETDALGLGYCLWKHFVSRRRSTNVTSLGSRRREYFLYLGMAKDQKYQREKKRVDVYKPVNNLDKIAQPSSTAPTFCD